MRPLILHRYLPSNRSHRAAPLQEREAHGTTPLRGRPLASRVRATQRTAFAAALGGKPLPPSSLAPSPLLSLSREPRAESCTPGASRVLSGRWCVGIKSNHIMIRVGVVGLGRMGSGMALNVAKAGFPLSVYDAEEGRTQELREGWVKDKHLPTGQGRQTTRRPRRGVRTRPSLS